MTLDERLERLQEMDSVVCKGKVANIVGSMIEVSGISANVGDICTIEGAQDSPPVLSEVVGFKNGNVLLVAYGDVKGVGLGSLVRSTGRKLWIPVGDFLIGRIIDATGSPRSTARANSQRENATGSIQPTSIRWRGPASASGLPSASRRSTVC